jgi:DNA gyrase subunit A
MGRPAYGVIGIRLDEGDYVIGMIAATSDAEMVLSVTEKGFGKRTSVDEYRTQGRGGKGIINLKTTEKNGKVVAIMQVDEESDVLVMTAAGKLIRVRSTDIRAVGRATQGVRLIAVDEDDKVSAATRLAEASDAAAEVVEEPPTVH